MESNAWERARDAIARASERDESVITPETAVSPFDASSTMVIPQPVGTPPRGPRPGPPGPRPGAPYGNGHPAPRSTHLPPEPPTRPVEVSDPRGAPARVAGARPPTAPFPAAGPDPHAATPHPGSARGDSTEPPTEPRDPDTEPGTHGTGAHGAAPRRSWWRRLLGR